MATPPTPPKTRRLSQTVKAQLRLRELIVGGVLKRASACRAGARGAHRRVAHAHPHGAGAPAGRRLLEALPSGGFMVKDFSEEDIRDAIELRGTLEAWPRGWPPAGVGAVLIAETRACLERIDALLAEPELTDATFTVYVEQNGRLHDLLAEMSGSTLVQRQLERVKTLPFASPNGFVFASALSPRSRDSLVVAQAQHHALLEAVVRHEGTRAEAIMREHARNAHQNFVEALQSHKSLQRIPGAHLIRKRAHR
jgi:GntR family transcriptional regulator of vanillate catabolism